jgi:ion channel-forming bestrophin family protein
MLPERQPNWFSTALRVEGSVLPYIWPRLLFFGSLSWGVAWLYSWQHHAPAEATARLAWLNFENLFSLTNNVACNLVLGLLLVFRTNTAYDRFWEGRKAWGTLVVTIRNLSRELVVTLGTVEDEALQALRERFNQRLMGFAIATKCRLRGEGMVEDLAMALSEADGAAMTDCEHRPLQLALWLGQDLKLLEQQNRISEYQRLELNQRINSLIEGLTTCERIISTPIPLSYGIYLKRLTLIYCLLLPLSVVSQLGWWTPLAELLVSFVLLGVDSIGNEIENPFGYDFNDLPLDQICEALQENVEQIVTVPTIYPRCFSLNQAQP